MPTRLSPLMAVAGLTMILWVVPSIGTQGMGTINQRFIHPDAGLFDRVAADRDAARAVLQGADTTTEAALGL